MVEIKKWSYKKLEATVNNLPKNTLNAQIHPLSTLAKLYYFGYFVRLYLSMPHQWLPLIFVMLYLRLEHQHFHHMTYGCDIFLLLGYGGDTSKAHIVEREA